MKQKMSAQTRRELLRSIRREYIAAGRKKRVVLLNGLVAATGYNGKYTIALLNNPLDDDVHRQRICCCARNVRRRERAGVSRTQEVCFGNRFGEIFTEWDDQEIGFFEVDLVAHCG